MCNISIKAEQIGKQYQLGKINRYGTLKEALTRMLRPKSRKASEDAASNQYIWALNDISFEISQGEIVGIVGRNGAGKSTLLKILAGITTPTCGKAWISGKIGCLLEVGAGFHPFLTGRENIFLSGAILGISRSDIKRMLDEIIAFAEIDTYIDTQIKYYSSGMYTRLAFAVAAHMVVDILIVDEVLSVGDLAFQKKCLGKMDDAAHDGRTVLFVSHNMATVQRLCHRGFLFHDGKMIIDANIDTVVSEYQKNWCEIPSHRTWENPTTAPGDDIVRLICLKVVNQEGKNIQTSHVQEKVGIEITYILQKSSHCPIIIFHFFDAQWLHLFSSHDFNEKQQKTIKRIPCEITETCWIPAHLLNQGQININVQISSLHPKKDHVSINEVLSFEAIDPRSIEELKGPFGGQWPGVVRPALQWDLKC